MNTTAQFPILIEPLAMALEIADANGKWMQFVRVKVKNDTFPFAVCGAMVHFFGHDADVKKCRFLLVYDSLGALRHRVVYENGQWELYEIPPEVHGQVEPVTSLRVLFGSERDAVTVGHILAHVKAGNDITPSQATALYSIMGNDHTRIGVVHVGKEKGI